MISEKEKRENNLSENKQIITPVSEEMKEKELVTLVANIIVEKVLNRAYEKGYSISAIQS